MKNIQIKNSEGGEFVNFDGNRWEFYLDDDEPTEMDQANVLESPYYLFYYLDQIGDSDQIVNQLSEQSPELREMIGDYFRQREKLDKRVILFEKEGSGMTSIFVDSLFVYGDEENGMTVETSTESDSLEESGFPPVNALGEIIGEQVSGVCDARQLFDAIKIVTRNDVRWEDIKFSWNDIIINLGKKYPQMASELKQISGEEQN